MTDTELKTKPAVEISDAKPVAMNLELVVIPVSDADRAKAFYESLGWRLDIDCWFSRGTEPVRRIISIEN